MSPKIELIERSKEILAWTQIVLIMVAFYGGQLVLKDKEHALELFSYRPPEWINWLPTAWLAKGLENFVSQPNFSNFSPLLILFVITAICIGLALVNLSKSYRNMKFFSQQGEGKEFSAISAVGDIRSGYARFFSSEPIERISLWFCTTIMRRDGDVKARIFTILSLFVGATVMGFATHQLGDPFAKENGRRIILSIFSVHLLVFAIPGMIYVISCSKDWEASWLFDHSPIESPLQFAMGMRKTVIYFAILPLLVVLFIIFSVLWKAPHHAFIHCLVGWITALIVSHLSMLKMAKRFPYSYPSEKGELLGPITIFQTVVAGGVCALVASAQYTLNNFNFLYISFVVFLVICSILISNLVKEKAKMLLGEMYES